MSLDQFFLTRQKKIVVVIFFFDHLCLNLFSPSLEKKLLVTSRSRFVDFLFEDAESLARYSTLNFSLIRIICLILLHGKKQKKSHYAQAQFQLLAFDCWDFLGDKSNFNLIVGIFGKSQGVDTLISSEKFQRLFFGPS